MSAQHFRPAVIEALKALWVALPVKAPGDYGEDTRERQMAILDAYCYALSDASSEAVWEAVNKLRAGKIEGASKDFCPKAPKLAEYARAEQSRIDAINRPRTISYQPATKPWVDHRIKQRDRTRELASGGFILLSERTEHPQFIQMAAARRIPPGSVWFWALQEIWGPRNG